MSFVEREIVVTIQLAEGTFDGVNDTTTLKGYRVSAQISGFGSDSASFLECRINGLPLTIMNQLTRVGPVNSVNKLNTIVLSAGKKGSALTQVFEGTIIQAWADFQSQQEAALHVSAWPGAASIVIPVPASSFKGSTDVGDIMNSLANLMGLTLENNGVNVKLSNPYFSGTALIQVEACARAADIAHTIENNILAIWPKYGFRKGNIPLISAETGMVGYPIYSSQGIKVTSEFLPDVRLGGQIQVNSTLAPANGIWNVFGVIHDLESEKPSGAWFTQATGFPASTQLDAA